ncbi:MAG: cupin domain-containing protein [Bdellovibrionota bacterium]
MKNENGDKVNKKPVINIDEVAFESHQKEGFCSSYAVVGNQIGAKKLGYNVSKVPPGKKVCPLHNHRQTEEMFFILEGIGTLRFGNQTYPLRKGDFIACPAGGPEVAHQIVNTGEVEMVYIALSTIDHVDVCEYPESKKMGIYVGTEWGNRDLRYVCKSDQPVNYYDGEK